MKIDKLNKCIILFPILLAIPSPSFAQKDVEGGDKGGNGGDIECENIIRSEIIPNLKRWLNDDDKDPLDLKKTLNPYTQKAYLQNEYEKEMLSKIPKDLSENGGFKISCNNTEVQVQDSAKVCKTYINNKTKVAKFMQCNAKAFNNLAADKKFAQIHHEFATFVEGLEPVSKDGISTYNISNQVAEYTTQKLIYVLGRKKRIPSFGIMDDGYYVDVIERCEADKKAGRSMPVLINNDCQKFIMGSPENEHGQDDEEKQHSVSVTKFEIAKTTVTQRQWFQVMGNNPSWYTPDRCIKEMKSADCYCNNPVKAENNKGISMCPDNPVESVSYNDAQDFISKLNVTALKKGDKYLYRLPTDAEFEYAARAGTQTAYYWGNEANKRDNYGKLIKDAYTWTSSNSDEMTHKVGALKANAWGLYDMIGNVNQWISGRSFKDSLGTYQGIRGCTWHSGDLDGDFLRFAHGASMSQNNHFGDTGFRLARTLRTH